MSPDELAAALLEKAAAFREGAEEQDSSSPAATEVTRSLRAVWLGAARSRRSSRCPPRRQVLELLRRELDNPALCASKCARACAVLMEEKHGSLLKAVGWDLLHTMLPFVDLPPAAGCAEAARGLLLRAAVLCNPRELFSMVMEAFIFFKVPFSRRVHHGVRAGRVKPQPAF